jgi:putative phage-type endonuclease
MPRLGESELASRRLGLGSTDIVEIAGLAPWSGAGPMRVWCEKTGISSANDEDEQDDDREHLEWGHIQEPVIADWYARKHGVDLMLGGRVPSPLNPRMWATLDRKVIGVPRLVEIKNVGSPSLYRHWDTSSPDGVPDYVRAQVTVAMGFSAATECDVVASIGGRPPHVWRVFADDALFGLLVDAGEKFLAQLDAGTPPPLDHTPASKAYLRAKYPENRERVIREATDREDEYGQDRAHHAFVLKSAAIEVAKCDALLMSCIGDADGIQGTGWKMTWKVNRNGVRMQRFTGRGSDE